MDDASKLVKFFGSYFLYRHLLGEDLGQLNLKELLNLEKQLEGALAQTRQRRVRYELIV